MTGGPASRSLGAGWTPERRAAQSARLRARQPWLKSTGPKSFSGKRRCRMNGLKHGHRSAAMRELSKLLAWQMKLVLILRQGRYHPPKNRFSFDLIPQTTVFFKNHDDRSKGMARRHGLQNTCGPP